MNKITLIVLAGISFSVFGQKTSKEIKGDKKYEIFAFAEAINKYSQVDGLSIEGKRRLAISYKNSGDLDSAKETYAGIINDSEMNGEDYFTYASLLRSGGNYTESDFWMNKFLLKEPSDQRAKNFVSNASEIPNLLKDVERYKVSTLDINSEQQDFGPSYYGDQITFASSREGVKSIRRKYNWNQMPFLDIYTADVESGQLNNPNVLNKKINNKMHEGPATFTKDLNTMVFTRNNYDGKSEDGTIKLKLFTATKDEYGKWNNESPFKYNSSEYSVAHPSLNSDGTVLYFASDMPGGKGGSDIYKVTKNSNGTWSDAINLGDKINTEGEELFPFYQEEQGVLFFSSNGHIGLGGLDLFISPENSKGNYDKVLNVGVPLNTTADDFSLIVDNKMKKGYFSSNRKDGKGDDDIYAFEILKPFTFGKIIKGIAKDKKGNVLKGTLVNLYDNNGGVIETATTAEDGKYSFNVDSDLDFKLAGTKEKYFNADNTASTRTEKEVIVADLILEKDPGLALYTLISNTKTGDPIEGVQLIITDNLSNNEFQNLITPSTGDARKGITTHQVGDNISYNITLSKDGYFPKTVTFNHKIDKPGVINVHDALVGGLSLDPAVTDLAKMIEINPINFDLNKYKIRPDAMVELDKIVKVMNEYPLMKVELGSHTDCRGSKKYNKSLSDRRAKSSATYIKSKITNPERIYGKGYGEERLLNGCACEGREKSTCSEEEHEKNRRTEFKVISIGDPNVGVKNNSTDSFNK